MTEPQSHAHSPAALVLIDIQQGMDDPSWGPRNNPDAEANAARLLHAWRGAGLPVVHIHHRSVRPQSPLYPGKAGVAVKPEVVPVEGEPVFTKTVNSAFIGTPLEGWLRERGIERVVIAGLTTNHCVDTSTRMAGNLGFETVLVGDACATNDRVGPDGATWDAETIHRITLTNLHGEFATVMSTDEVLATIPAKAGAESS
jgi:nicotinamidase-related amidase